MQIEVILQDELANSIAGLRQSIEGTIVPQNMPQLIEPWQQAKDKTAQAIDLFPQVAKALSDQKPVDASRLLDNVASNLNEALNDGFDRVSALADRLPSGKKMEVAINLSPEDKRKSDQVKILSVYETLGYYVSNLNAAFETLGQRPYGEMEASDWARLEKAYRTFQRELTGLKAEFNQDTMKRLEASKVLTEGQKHLLAKFRESINTVMPALLPVDNTSPFAGKTFTPVYSGLIDQMEGLCKLSSKISGKVAYLQTELNLKNELKTAPEWKKNLLEQKLVLWQYYPLANRASDVKDEVTTFAQEADGAAKIDKVNKYAWTRKGRKNLLSVIETFQADFNPDALKSLEEYDKCSAITSQQVEFLKQFRSRYVQAQPHIEAIRQGIEPTETIDLSGINSTSTTLLEDLSNDRRLIMDTIKELDDQIHMRNLSDQTSPSLKPLVHQYKTYNQLTQISDAIDEIGRDAQDMLFLTGGYYSKKALAVRLPERAGSMLSRISSFKKLVGSEEKRQQLASMISSNDLTAQQSTQLKEFYDNVLVLIPQIDELENNVRLGVDKHFWKISRAAREQMEKSHTPGFEITLAGYHLHGQLLKAIENKK